MRTLDATQIVQKFEWSRRKFHELDDVLADYIERKPFFTDIEEQTTAAAFKVTARLREDLPWEATYMVADVLNSLRSSLDYLAWQLVVADGGQPNAQTAFPIIKKPAEKGETEVNIKGGPSKNSRLPQITSSDYLDLLRQAQPFALGDDAPNHWLAVLDTLNNHAKHRAPNILVCALREAIYPYQASAFGTGENAVAMVMGSMSPVRDGDELAWVSKAFIGDDELPVYDDYRVVITCADFPVVPNTEEPLMVTRILAGIWNYINNDLLIPLGITAFDQPAN